LNHASIIDGMRLMAKGVTKKIYRHSDLEQLETLLKETQSCPTRWVVTDGVFSMEGDIAKLPELVSLCEQYNAMLVVDDSHGVGVLGTHGKGIHEHFGLLGKVDVFTGTLGKALGGRPVATLPHPATQSRFSNNVDGPRYSPMHCQPPSLTARMLRLKSSKMIPVSSLVCTRMSRLCTTDWQISDSIASHPLRPSFPS
jgi:glycine C-acetyltransferase